MSLAIQNCPSLSIHLKAWPSIAGVLAIAFVLVAAPASLAREAGRLKFEYLTMDDGLPNESIRSILQDHQGFLWFGHDAGLSKYDGHRFINYTHRRGDPTSLPAGYIMHLYQDSSGNLWIGSAGGGLTLLDRGLDIFTTYNLDPDDPRSLSSTSVGAIFEDRSGRLWVGTGDGGLNRFDPATGTAIRYHHDSEDPDSPSTDGVTAIREDHGGILWLGTGQGLYFLDLNDLDQDRPRFVYERESFGSELLMKASINMIHESRAGDLWLGTDRGLVRVDRARRRVSTYRHDPEDPSSLSHDNVHALHEDQGGDLWIGTMGGGLDRFDADQGRESAIFSHHRFAASDPRSLSSDMVSSIYRDAAGILWIGTFAGGVNKLDPARQHFVDYFHDRDDPASLSPHKVMSVVEESSGNLWIGTLGGGLDRFDREQGIFEHFRHDPENPETLSQDHVWDLLVDRDDVLWVATWEEGLNRFDRENHRFIRYQHDEQRPDSLSDDRIMDVHEDDAGVLWVGTWGGGLNRLDADSGRHGSFSHYLSDPEDPGSLSSNFIYALADAAGDLWVATHRGLNRLDRETGRCRRFLADPDDSDNVIHALHRDAEGVLWIGSSAGLSRFDPHSGDENRLETYFAEDRIPRIIYTIQSDERGQIWLGSNQGLYRFDPQTKTIREYDRSDGLIDISFSVGSGFRSGSGEMYFGHSDGFVSFFPDELVESSYRPRVALTDFLLFNDSVPIAGEGTDSPLERHVNLAPEIVLSHRQSVFSFEFSALDFAAPEKNRYAHRLLGFDKDWSETDADRRFVTYTNLDQGSYTFEVKATNRSGVWSDEVTRLALTILPPWWKTWWANVFYVLAVSGIVVGYVLAQQRKVARERAINSRLRQVDKLKDQFLANTSHELRTPLNGIIGLADSLIDGIGGDLPEAAKQQLSILVSTGKRLTSLVGDVLDFSKLKSHNIELRRRPVDLYTLAEVVLTLSRAMVTGKDLALANEIPADLPAVCADENRLQQILYNLLGNAIKFTKAGSVTVSATAEGNLVTVCVADTGIGIAEEKFEHIFESFTQADGSTERTYGGTGLGLTVTRQLVELHGGRIWVESTPGQGSRFFFTLESSDEPATMPETKEIVNPIVRSASPGLEPEPSIAAEAGVVTFPSGFTILIVDDEPVNRLVIKNYLARQPATVLEVPGGEEALAALESGGTVDLVLLDIMMPKISGYEVCERLRESYSPYELPIIFLSARNQVTDLIDAFTKGANDYLTKPVAKNELLLRLNMHLELLDTHRRLEEKLEERAGLIRRRNQELETMDTIIKTINEEIERAKVIETLLEQGRVLFPQAEKARFLLFDEELDAYRFVASIGYETEEIERTFTLAQAMAHFSEGEKSLEQGCYVVHPFRLIGSPKSRSIPASILVMTIVVAGDLEGFLLLDNYSAKDAFQDSDLATMRRFREHANLALVRAEMIERQIFDKRRGSSTTTTANQGL